MSIKSRLILIGLLLIWFSYAAQSKEYTLQVHLPRQVTVNDNMLELGEIGIIRGDQSVVNKASEIGLGRLSLAGQEIVIDRNVILSRLACNGIDQEDVRITGAQQVKVTQLHKLISSDDFIELANEFLAKKSFGQKVCGFSVIRKPQELILSGEGKDVTFKSTLTASSAQNQIQVRILVFVNGEQKAVREIPFKLQYQVRQIVTTEEIEAGGKITADNIRVETIVSDNPESERWKVPIGLLAHQKLAQGTVIKPGMIEEPVPDVLIKRNESVVIRIETEGLLVTASGKAIEQGVTGDSIRVQNIDSQRIIICRIKSDGTVEPVL